MTIMDITEFGVDKAYTEAVESLFAGVEPHLDAFSMTHSLELLRWYHDAPVWIFTWKADGLARSIHVGPTGDTTQLGISVAVDAYQAYVSGLTGTERKALKRGIVIGKLGSPVIESDPEQVMKLLEKAYKRASAVSEADLS